VTASTYLGQMFPDADLPHVRLGGAPTPVRRAELPDLEVDLWVKDDGAFGDGGWAGNKVRKLEWIIPEAHRRGADTLFTVGGIGTHWGLAAALYGREHGLRTVLGLVDQPVDDHVREQLARLQDSGAIVSRHASVRRLKLAAPAIMARCVWRSRGTLPYYLPAGGSSPVGALGYVDAGLEIAAQVKAGVMPAPDTVVSAVGSGGTAAGLAVGLRLGGLDARVLGVVVNDSFRLDATTIAQLARETAALLRQRGADVDVQITPDDLTADARWLGVTYGATTPESTDAAAWAAPLGLSLEPVYTAKALAALRQMRPEQGRHVLFLGTHGPKNRRASRMG